MRTEARHLKTRGLSPEERGMGCGIAWGQRRRPRAGNSAQPGGPESRHPPNPTTRTWSEPTARRSLEANSYAVSSDQSAALMPWLTLRDQEQKSCWAPWTADVETSVLRKASCSGPLSLRWRSSGKLGYGTLRNIELRRHIDIHPLIPSTLLNVGNVQNKVSESCGFFPSINQRKLRLN